MGDEASWRALAPLPQRRGIGEESESTLKETARRFRVFVLLHLPLGRHDPQRRIVVVDGEQIGESAADHRVIAFFFAKLDVGQPERDVALESLDGGAEEGVNAVEDSVIDFFLPERVAFFLPAFPE